MATYAVPSSSKPSSSILTLDRGKLHLGSSCSLKVNRDCFFLFDISYIVLCVGCGCVDKLLSLGQPTLLLMSYRLCLYTDINRMVELLTLLQKSEL